jgi:hypothetical protein
MPVHGPNGSSGNGNGSSGSSVTDPDRKLFDEPSEWQPPTMSSDDVERMLLDRLADGDDDELVVHLINRLAFFQKCLESERRRIDLLEEAMEVK